MIMNIASGANSLYGSIIIFAVVFVVLIVFAEMLIKRGYYRNIPGFLQRLRRTTNSRREQWRENRTEKEARKADAERLRLQTENEQLSRELTVLRSELEQLKTAMDRDVSADSAAEFADPPVVSADTPAAAPAEIAPPQVLSDKAVPTDSPDESDIPPVIIPGPDDIA